MHTVIETPAFVRSADKAGMTEDERAGAVDIVAANPEAGDLIVGSGGCRKVRVAGRGHGKSGGYRVITYFTGGDGQVFLLWAISKGRDANLTDRQVNEIAKFVKTLA